jgi:hypothetical protein
LHCFDGAHTSITFKFSSVELSKIGGNNTIKLEFCGSAKIGLARSIGSLNLSESYSTVNLKPASNLATSYTIHTNYTSFVNRSNIDIRRTDKPNNEYGPDLNQTYEGKSRNGSASIKIKSSFGKIIIGEPQPGDIKEKKKRDKNTDSEEI